MQFFDHNILLDAPIPEVVEAYRKATERYSEQDITKDLLEAIDIELIPPTCIGPWLSIASEAQVLKDALLQESSVFVRQAAIKQIARWLRKHKWKEIWVTLGEGQGIIDIMETLSLQDVRAFAAGVGESYRNRVDEKVAAITDLFWSFYPSLSSNGTLMNKDSRPLQGLYLGVLPACSDACVEEVILKQRLFGYDHLSSKFLHSHPKLIQRLSVEKHGIIRKAIPEIDLLWQSLPARSDNTSEISPSMSFALNLIRRATFSDNESRISTVDDSIDRLSIYHSKDERKLGISQSEELADFHSIHIPAVLTSLTRRAVKKRSACLHEVLTLGTKYYSECPDAVTRSSKEYHIFLLAVIEAWSNHHLDVTTDSSGIELEALVVKMIRLTRDRSNEADSHWKLLSKVPKIRRYRLLHILMLEQRNTDIEKFEDLFRWKVDAIPLDVFNQLDDKVALTLLRRLMDANPELAIFSKPPQSAIYLSSDLADPYVDCNILLMELLAGNDEALNLAQRVIEERQNLAQKSRDPAARAFYVRTVILYASLSRSFTLFFDAVAWVRKRFLKDPMTVKEVFASSGLTHEHAVYLLAGIRPGDQDLLVNSDTYIISETVKKANETWRYLYDTMIEAFAEPSYHATNWSGVTFVLTKALELRAKAASWLETSSNLSEQEIFESVWAGTTNLLLDIQRQILQPKWSGLGYHDPDYMLIFTRDVELVYSRTTFRFLDLLAQQRDDIWRQYRLLEVPASAEIPSPFPAGLPIQCLVNTFNALRGWSPIAAPYLAGRAKAIAFMPPEHAMAPVPSTPDKKSIRSFIDSVRIATKMWTFQDRNVELQRRRLDEVWFHWMDLLCNHKLMSKRNAGTFLWTYLQPQDIMTDFRDPRWDDFDIPNYPIRPRSYGVEVTEWDPASDVPVHPEEQTFQPTTLDCFFKARPNFIVMNQDFIEPEPWKVKHGLKPILSMQRLRSRCFFSSQPRKTRPTSTEQFVEEGIILASLLSLDSKRSSGDRLLKTAFPSSEYVRYPNAYLDSTFLERKGTDSKFALMTLDELIVKVPPSLLLSMIEGGPTVDLLLRSDKPYLAIHYLIDKIINHPDISSWHRQLLTVGFLRRLSRASFENLFTKLVDAVVRAVELQRQGSSTKSENNQQPAIKVTTIKHVLSLIQDSKCVPPVLALKTAHGLFEICNHIDIKAAAIEVMLDQLSKADVQTQSRFLQACLSALKPAIFIIAAVNERIPLTEDQWKVYEDTKTVPDLSVYVENEKPPVLGKLMQVELPDSTSRIFVEQILVPAAELSVRNNQQMLRVVLNNIDTDVALADVVVPFNPLLTSQLLGKYWEYLPQWWLESFHRLQMLNLNPTSSIVKVSAHFKSTQTRLKSNAGQFWFMSFPGSEIRQHLNSIPRLLANNLPEQDDSCISLELVQRIAKETADCLILHFDHQNISTWTSFEKSLAPDGNIPRSVKRLLANTSDGPRLSLRYKSPCWTTNVAPVVSYIVDKISSLRTPEWDANPARKPSSLPSTLQLRSWLLEYPEPIGGRFHHDQLQRFAETLFHFLIDSVDPARQTYTQAINTVVAITKQVKGKDHILLQCYLGSLCEQNIRRGKHVSLALYLAQRVESCLIMGRKEREQLDAETKLQLMELSVSWKGSSNEELRTLALGLDKSIFV